MDGQCQIIPFCVDFFINSVRCIFRNDLSLYKIYNFLGYNLNRQPLSLYFKLKIMKIKNIYNVVKIGLIRFLRETAR